MKQSEKCELTDSFAVIVQILLASLALSSLLYKRQREQPKRPLWIWFLDTSKQAIAASLVHFTNLFLSLISKDPQTDNPCVFYFLNLGLDTTVGVGILYLFLMWIHGLCSYVGVTEIEMGVYGEPPKLYAWFKQLLIFLLAWVFVKLIVVLSIHNISFLIVFAEWILRPLTEQRTQVIVVLFLFPLVMNIIQAWLTDTVIKGYPSQLSRQSSVDSVPSVDSQDSGIGPDVSRNSLWKRIQQYWRGGYERVPQ
ncbi:vacuolar membrane protein-domain-containing protein [Gorgonomyces haynaldii]|nr:vacuolar membrane protein-domain-containing protein [Gorgonomyces haynaldii]